MALEVASAAFLPRCVKAEARQPRRKAVQSRRRYRFRRSACPYGTLRDDQRALHHARQQAPLLRTVTRGEV
jgi:hypothetical protein